MSFEPFSWNSLQSQVIDYKVFEQRFIDIRSPQWVSLILPSYGGLWHCGPPNLHTCGNRISTPIIRNTENQVLPQAGRNWGVKQWNQAQDWPTGKTSKSTSAVSASEVRKEIYLSDANDDINADWRKSCNQRKLLKSLRICLSLQKWNREKAEQPAAWWRSQWNVPDWKGAGLLRRAEVIYLGYTWLQWSENEGAENKHIHTRLSYKQRDFYRNRGSHRG